MRQTDSLVHQARVLHREIAEGFARGAHIPQGTIRRASAMLLRLAKDLEIADMDRKADEATIERQQRALTLVAS